jgi:glutamate synthase (NADPH/NADH) large chain
MMRKCHLNTCPVGVATQHPELRKRFRGQSGDLINYFKFLAEEVREILAELGFKSIDEIVGRTDLIEPRKVDHWKAKTVDVSRILHRPEGADKKDSYCVEDQIHKIDDILDRKLIEKSKDALASAKKVSFETQIINLDRSVGAMLSNQVSLKYEDKGLPEDTINVKFHGSAGQSFGAFLAKGCSFRLEGDANDYLGKGLSGGKIVVVPPKGSTFKPEENIIVGNTLLYGAIEGEVFIRGIAGERFGVRNSGAVAVVEGTGDHCAEYMTGGNLIVLGKVGRNFGAGMSGGIAYVLDEDGSFDYFCNKGMVELTPVDSVNEQEFIKERLQKHLELTESTVAKKILASWDEYLPKFIKVMPLEYKRALQEMKMKKLDKQLENVKEEEQLGEQSDG